MIRFQFTWILDNSWVVTKTRRYITTGPHRATAQFNVRIMTREEPAHWRGSALVFPVGVLIRAHQYTPCLCVSVCVCVCYSPGLHTQSRRNKPISASSDISHDTWSYTLRRQRGQRLLSKAPTPRFTAQMWGNWRRKRKFLLYKVAGLWVLSFLFCVLIVEILINNIYYL